MSTEIGSGSRFRKGMFPLTTWSLHSIMEHHGAISGIE